MPSTQYNKLNSNDLDTVLILDRLLELETKFISGLGNQNKLSINLIPRGISRKDAAGYIGISSSKFDNLVKDGTLPKPVRIGSRTIWDRDDLDECFDRLKFHQEPPGNPWDDICRDGRADQ